ncbi:hypothetical protein Tco_1111696 [Tanacetum coccineum]|uniref:Uncharacterized protein n=1 Tax=Tanacetum coccineum TaxID=301880 RepID=A0ABQ5IMF4_9ASTR
MRRKGKEFFQAKYTLVSKYVDSCRSRGEGSEPLNPKTNTFPDQSFMKNSSSDIPSYHNLQRPKNIGQAENVKTWFLIWKAMTAQAKEIAILKKRVKKLEKRKRSRTQGLKLFKMGTSKRRSLDKEDASKHGRNLNARLISKEDDFDAGFDVVRDEVNAGVSVSTAEPKTPPTTTTTTLLEDDDVTVAATLVQMSETSKAKSIVFEDKAREGRKLLELTKRKAVEVLESAKYYTEEDWDIIRANVESNAELSKILLGENELVGPELQFDIQKQKTTEVKEVPVTEEPVKEPTAPKQEEIEQPIKKSGRQKSMARKRKLGQSMARKRKLGQSTAKEDEEYEKEKEELSMFLIIAFDEQQGVDYEILDQRSPIIAWNSEYYGRNHYMMKLRDDLSALYQLVIDKYQDKIPKGFDLILWGDLTTMFHPNEEDDF